MSEEVKTNVCHQDEIGQRAYADFAKEQINSNKVEIRARMKKLKLKLWKSSRKVVKHKYADQVEELKDDDHCLHVC